METRSTMPEGLPERTLGWDFMDWCEEHLEIPHGEHVGNPWRFTREQGRFILWWYALDERGQFLYRRGTIRRSKGWGKDPLAAVIAMCELMGPCRFGGWNSRSGEPLSIPSRPAWVSIGAVSEEQTRTTTSLFSTLVKPKTIEKYSMQLGERVWRAYVEGSKQECRPVASSFRSNEGARPTIFIMNETQHWVRGTKGKFMAEVIRRNLAKSPGGQARPLSLTNAHSPGEGSVAEDDYNSWRGQMDPEFQGVQDILYDCVEPVVPEDFRLNDLGLLREAIKIAYGDATWIDIDRIVAEVLDPSMDPAEAKRFYLNLLVAGAGQWMDPSSWDAMFIPGFRPPEGGGSIALGFDGSKNFDSTALVATDMATGDQWVEGLWERNTFDPDWEVPIAEVINCVDRVFARYDVVRFYCDPYYWEEEVADWCNRWDGVAAGWYTGGHNKLKVARALHGYRQAIYDGFCHHGGANHEAFRRHVLSAVTRPLNGDAGDEGLHTISKQDSATYSQIDIAMAGMMSWEARNDAITAGWTPEVEPGAAVLMPSWEQ